MTDEPYLTTRQFADKFQVDFREVAAWCRYGLLQTLPRTPGRAWRIHPSEVHRIEQEGLPPNRKALDTA